MYFIFCFFEVKAQDRNELRRLFQYENYAYLDSAIFRITGYNKRDKAKQPHGVWITRNKSGKVIAIYTMSHGVPHGHCVNFTDSGAIKNSLYFYFGVMHGPYIDFWENGRVKASLVYFEGKLNGIVKQYYSNGDLERISEYLYGVRNGLDILYNLDGSQAACIRYKNGKVVD